MVGGAAHRRRSSGERFGNPLTTVVVADILGSDAETVAPTGAAGRLTSSRARMWLGEAPISLMLETSLVHPHTIVSIADK
jgi:hypothetical protein